MKTDREVFLNLLNEVYISYLKEEEEYEKTRTLASDSIKNESNIRFTFDFSKFIFEHENKIRYTQDDLEQISAFVLEQYKVFAKKHISEKYFDLRTINIMLFLISFAISFIADYIEINIWGIGIFFVTWFLLVSIYAQVMMIKLRNWDDFYNTYKVFNDKKILQEYRIHDRLCMIFGLNKLYYIDPIFRNRKR